MEFILVIILFIVSLGAGYYIAKSRIKVEQRTIDSIYLLERDQLRNEVIDLHNKRESYKDTIKQLEAQANEAGQAFYDKTMALVNSTIAYDIEILENQFEKHKANCEQEYADVAKELAANCVRISTKYQNSIEEIKRLHAIQQKKLDDISSKVDAAVESGKVALLDGIGNQYYRCMISDLFQKEIIHLRSVEPYLIDSRPLCKIIWESYYRNSCSALLERLTKGAKITGIYKITNLDNGKVYIGQAVNVADRLRTHIKAGIGIDPTNSELYKDMKKIGVENFTFEILEECAQPELNDKEKFWINFYHGQDFGYNITKGGSQRISN